MILIKDLSNQLQQLYTSIFFVFLTSFLVVGSVFGFHYYNNVPLYKLTSDVLVAADAPIYFGIQSQIGIFFWAATAAICFYSSRLIDSSVHKKFLIFSGCITLFLGLDDIFMFHEIVFPSLGIHQKIVFLSYAVVMLFYGLKYTKLLLKTDYILLVLAVGGFGISLVADNFFYNYSEYITQLLEDGAKFMGIVSWTLFFGRTSLQMVKNDIKN